MASSAPSSGARVLHAVPRDADGERTLRRSLAHVPALDPQALSLLFTHPRNCSPTHWRSSSSSRTIPSSSESSRPPPAVGLPEQGVLMHRLYRVARAGREFRIVLADIRLALPFPPQVVPDEGPLRFIRNGSELTKSPTDTAIASGATSPMRSAVSPSSTNGVARRPPSSA